MKLNSMSVNLLNQPQDLEYHFQYEYQPKVWLWGKSSSAEDNACPIIRIFGYKGRAILQISCVTKNKSYR